ncbi:MAG: toxic anion resistance protein [Bavariicoccus seileri]|uniref:Toxic anion resistance protein n=1 Tax=Bavariicoccus seileri TaxID=549685 RepID=A0A3D4S443_9ENTE|nr:toxic anion resistance protein [Bavariicoccus seileri]HCS93583.1 toxic anion resistance protein [Bavariicoccus seileri]
MANNDISNQLTPDNQDHTSNGGQSNDVDALLSNPFGDPNDTTADFTPKNLDLDSGDEAPKSKLIDTLTEERQQQARALAKQIDESNPQAIITYGAAAQKQLSEFSQQMLLHVQNKDTGEIGESLTELMFKLNETDPKELAAAENNVLKKWFGKAKQSVYQMTAKYQQVGTQVDKIALKLKQSKSGLMNDNRTLEQIYQKNKNFYEALNVYIAAGEVKLEELETVTIPQAVSKTTGSKNQMDVQVVSDLRAFAERLDKRNHDLKLTRQMTIQQAPQIRLIQNTNQALAEKIQSSITTAIPLWKNQIAIAMTLFRQRDAVAAQRQVSETTNDLMKRNSEMLKQSSIETAKENERGIIDIETLQKTQNDLLETLEETVRIQQEGRQKRRSAEKELGVMENQLKQQLLSISRREQSGQ